MEALEIFAHPDGRQPFRVGEDVVASNGHAFVKVSRGHFFPGDFREDSDRAAKVAAAPWGLFEIHGKSQWWRRTEVELHRIFKLGVFAPFYGPRLERCPVIRINDGVMVRASLLQLACRLPGTEIFCDLREGQGPLLFRFSGGVGMIAPCEGPADIHIFRDSYCFLTRERETPFEKRPPKPQFQPMNRNWPPPEPTD
jgi:hypothetical protein